VRDLILLVLNGEANADDERALVKWRNESPENERVYQEYAFAWKVLLLHASEDPVTVPPPVAEVVAAGNRRRRKAIPLRERQKNRVDSWRWLGVASAATAATLILCLPALLEQRPDVTVSTGTTEYRTVALEDGSVVRLGPGSRLDFRNGKERHATLYGSGFFAVASDSASPFIVATETGTARALGTRFEVRANEDSLRLVVVEGSVALSASGNQVFVKAGEMSTIEGDVPPAVPQHVNVWEVLEWRAGLLIFHDTPLGDVVAEVGAFFDVEFSFADSTLAHRVVTAWFENEPFEDVVGTICQAVGVRCTLDEGVEISR
jgi:transmembrane sensor